MEKEKNLAEKVNETYDFIEQVKLGKIKTKDLKIPRKAKVKGRKLRKGWVGILKVDENGNISGTKVQLENGGYDFKQNTFHATDGSEMLFWNGKFPVLIQPTWATNPVNLREMKPKHETYGEKVTLAMVLKATLVKAKKMGGAVLWIVLGIAAIIGYSLLSKGGA